VDQAAKVLAKFGIYMSEDDKRNMRVIAVHESGGDPHSVNNYDGNARAGHPSKGLVQTIDSTFDTYSLPGYKDIFNPVDNLIAGYRYAVDRYGSPGNSPGIRQLERGERYGGY
jgi:SLT domain-containing protein